MNDKKINELRIDVASLFNELRKCLDNTTLTETLKLQIINIVDNIRKASERVAIESIVYENELLRKEAIENDIKNAEKRDAMVVTQIETLRKQTKLIDETIEYNHKCLENSDRQYKLNTEILDTLKEIANSFKKDDLR